MTRKTTSTGRARRRPGAASEWHLESMTARWLELQSGRVASRWPGSARSPSVPAGALHRSWEPQPRTLMLPPPVETGWGEGHEDTRRQVSPARALRRTRASPLAPAARPHPQSPDFMVSLSKPIALKLPPALHSPCYTSSEPWGLSASLRFPKKDLVTSKRKHWERKGRRLNPLPLGKLTRNVLTLKLGPGHSCPFIVILYTLHVRYRCSFPCVQRPLYFTHLSNLYRTQVSQGFPMLLQSLLLYN